MNSFRAVPLVLGWLLSAASGFGQVALPIEFRQTETQFNYQDQRGVPISQTTNSPAGSSGKQPTGNESTGVFVPPSPKQFRNLLSFGAIPGLKNLDWQAVSNNAALKAGSAAFSGVVAQDMKLPTAVSQGTLLMALRRAQIGAPFLSRQVSFAFGAVIVPPVKNEAGDLLPELNASSYWLPEPFTVTSHTNSGYYWSPHARLVYATQPGPLAVTWVKNEAIPVAQPVTYTNPNGTPSFRTNGANKFLLYTERYIVSGGAAKPSRKMYWTQKGFQNIGKPIVVPTARVGAVNIVYNNNFPRAVTNEFVGVGSSSPTDGSTNATLKELRTLWFEQGTINAYNAEGRVFVELLGDLRTDGQTYVPLGTEIVDVSKQALPSDVQIELGERITPPDGGSLEELTPSPLNQATSQTFAYQHNVNGADKVQFWATRETRNLNDYLVHWMEQGEAGLLWPKLFGRYELIWPTNVAQFSLYVRPEVATDLDAQKTAVQIEPVNAPVIEYQDPLDFPRAKFTSDLKFYTFLSASQPVHRTLLRVTSGEEVGFERVFSWFEGNLRTTNFLASAIATNLTAWNGTTLVWPNELKAPRVVNQSVVVGERINPPAGEFGSTAGQPYLAGYLNEAIGRSFHPDAYQNPFTKGFEAANMGAIIPVNAIPGTNQLEVWWFRPNTSSAGLNAGNGALGFRSIQWPSVMGRYTIVWPANPREIVLASKLGGTGLSTSEALGTIYAKNVKGETGYNPNEEHAIMSGGTPFATRDDLNIITQTNQEYSSQPFVLVDFKAPDGRPAMATFKVLREKPEAGWVFDYIVPAGQMLQPPPPLQFLPKPIEGSGDTAINYNTEPPNAGGDLPGGWNNDTANAPYGHYQRFTYRDRHDDYWVYRGPNSGLEPLAAGSYDVNSDSFSPLTAATAVVGEPFSLSVHVSRQDEFLSMTVAGAPAWLSLNGLTLQGTPPLADVGSASVQLVVRDIYDNSRVTNDISLEVVATGSVLAQAPLAMVSSNSYTGSVITFTNRPPFLAGSPAPSNSFTLRYYYKTLPSFAWPGSPNPPAAGSIVPYLRPLDSTTGEYVGAGDAKTTAALEIVYRPIWPVRDPKDGSKPVPTLPFAASLTKPAFNLPGVRDFKTAHVLYQQSIAADLPTAAPSVVLHDGTRAKYVDITTEFAETGKIPSGVKAELYQGKYYFPNLPPHLATRVFIDPNRGSKGSLALVGEFKNEILGESYLQLNVLRGSDLEAVFALCPTADADNYPKWTNLVAALATPVETFYENPAQPGTYIPNDVQTESIGVGDLAEVKNDNVAVDSYALTAVGPGSGYVTLLEASGTAFTEAGDPVAMHIFKVGGDLNRGELKIIASANPLSEFVTFQHTGDLAGRYDEYEYEWKIAAPVDGFPPVIDATMSRYLPLTTVSTNIPRYTLGGTGVQVLGDNYVVMRYRPIVTSHPLYQASPADADWSQWTQPALAQGWIKRVLAGINPFNQRINDLFNNQVNTDVSIITQAGRRWEGDVALNLDTINNYGLIEIYETVLRRGRSMSIESGFNYGPANDALLLAAGYLSDLYMMVGNEAWADAANPTIGIGTADNTYGDIATALFAFRGQMPTLLEEELALLRGRDDIFQPGVEVTPVYNRLVWNYTRGIDAGEVIYALNYNIQEKPDSAPDGIINAEDAARMFPQGHGDAYGHYLTSIKGYFSLLANPNFDWVPRIEAVNVLGKPVSVDYQDERKFAAAAASLARAGRQVFDLTWRKDFQPVHKVGWEQFAQTRENTQRSFVNVTDGGTNHPVRNWGLDHWASRVGQGAYLNWVVGNAILPDVDPIPTHEGIQKVDRMTVPELKELVTLASALQTTLDNAEGGLSPLGVPEDGLVFDLNPNLVVGVIGGTHFEQVYSRATAALNNAVTAFDDAKDVTRLMRSEQDSLAGFQTGLAQQELSFTNALIELYGTPYPDDIGPGKLYKQGYSGPDLIHYSYVDLPEYDIPEMWSYTSGHSWSFTIQDVPFNWATEHQFTDINLPPIFVSEANAAKLPDGSPRNGISLNVVTLLGIPVATNFVFEVNVGDHGFFEKPKTWASRRASPGAIQQAISAQIAAHGRLRHDINDVYGDLGVIQKTIDVFKAGVADYDEARGVREDLLIAEQVLEKVKFANDLIQKIQDSITEDIEDTANLIAEGFPDSLVAGLAAGGDLTSAGRAAVLAAGLVTKKVVDGIGIARYTVINALELAVNTSKTLEEFYNLEPLARNTELRNTVQDLVNKLGDAQERWWTVNERVRELDDAQRALRALIAQGDRIQAERQVFRQRSAAVVQGYRTRDAAFRLFRNEKLERYKTLFDLSARYGLLAANAYDYETGLLGTRAGRDFRGRIIASRALGVVSDGEPQFAGSNTGDPGISSALAEMKADWDVVRGRLGINRPDTDSTTVSLRTEKERILPGTEGDINWKDVLNRARKADILTDSDVRRFCMQIDNGSGLPVPGLILTFSTTIGEGVNLFGRPLAAGDHTFSPSFFATKIGGVGVALEGYRGMGDPSAIANAVVTADGASATDPSLWFLDPQGLAATPYVYLIPVGVDSMRSPPLGDTSQVRTWNVQDLAIPMPFNIGGSDFSTKQLYQSADSLIEPLFGIRKHPAFRPVSDIAKFELVFYSDSLPRTEFLNERLVGRSVWNSQWKLVIPGRSLLANPNEGLDRLIQTLTDIKLNFTTYSYSGN
jgi:hypothetical protein